MSVSSASIKKIAKEVLKNNFISLTVATIIVMSVWFIIFNFAALVQYFTGLFAFYIVVGVFAFFVFSPLVMGYFRYCWRMISGVSDNPVALFHYFTERSLYLKTLKFTFSILFRTVICYLIFYIPVFILDIITGTWLYNTLDITMPMWTINLSTISSILKFLAFIATIISIMKFYLAPMLFVADEKMVPDEALHLSAVISKRTTLDFVFLVLSFFGWILLSLLSVPLLFTLPYFAIAYLIHSSYSVSAFNESIAHINYNDIPTFIAGV